MSMTKGEYRVGISFNPSANDSVAQIKRSAAGLIDLIETIPTPELTDEMSDDEWEVGMEQTVEIVRLKALAQTAIEEGAMWAVKAATKGQMK